MNARLTNSPGLIRSWACPIRCCRGPISFLFKGGFCSKLHAAPVHCGYDFLLNLGYLPWFFVAYAFWSVLSLLWLAVCQPEEWGVIKALRGVLDGFHFFFDPPYVCWRRGNQEDDNSRHTVGWHTAVQHAEGCSQFRINSYCCLTDGQRNTLYFVNSSTTLVSADWCLHQLFLYVL